MEEVLLKKSLGKGLGSLIRSNDTNYINKKNPNSKTEVYISDIVPNKNQPRKNFNNESLLDLAESIKVNGILQPIAVREIGNNKYEIIAGERRWRAAQKAQLSKIPIIIYQATDKKTLELGIMENVQREDLNPIDEALAIKELQDIYNFSQDEIIKLTGKKRTTLINILRILELPGPVQQLIVQGRISRGHGIALLSIKDEEKIIKTAKEIITKDLSVRKIEKLGQEANNLDSNIRKASPDIYLENLSKRMEDKLGSKIKIKGNSNSGKIEIEYKSLEELNKIFSSLK